MSLLSLSWRDVCFAHWDLDPSVVATHLPEGLSVDTYDGRAYLGCVALEITGTGVGRTVENSFAELNLRTYVRRDGEPGVYFFSLDAADRTAARLGRTLYGLPYYAAEGRLRAIDGRTRFDLRRTDPSGPPARFVATYGPDGEHAEAEDGSLAAFLVERYRFYLERAGRLWAGEIDHRPWRVAPAIAEIRSNSLAEAAGFPPLEGQPHLLHAEPDDMPVTAEPLRPA